MTAWDIEPGLWEIVQGVDRNGDDIVDGDTSTRTVELDRTGSIDLLLPPRVATILSLRLVSKGTPYWARPDLGIGKDDVVVQGHNVTVTVHSLGAVDAPATKLALLDRDGKVLSSVTVPGLKGPVDLIPKTTRVTLKIPSGSTIDGGSVVLDPDGAMKEITRINNRVKL